MADPTKCDRCGLHADPTTMLQGVCARCTDALTRDEFRALEEFLTEHWQRANTVQQGYLYSALAKLRRRRGRVDGMVRTTVPRFPGDSDA